ncbi:Glutathione S-transferase 3 [Lasiodiplodia hormozganensis]|uniref:glutathione transferase n=1 Tax=Lasiodiplodia hormozganensis TaxID=869390 RepID=A0AA39U347_9PEZI|nr:Glutathione S-transferase 3 [Lasiodiplodia hormozganensis]
MTIVVHHLQRSASERIIWLLEELDVPYELKTYRRDAETIMAPPEYKALHPVGTSPIIPDGPTTLSETSAIMEYILAKRAAGPGKPQQLAVPASAPNYTDYVFWLHCAISSLQSDSMLATFVSWAGVPRDHIVAQVVQRRPANVLAHLDARLRASPWLASDALTAADVYPVFTVTTMRLFVPFALEGRDGIRAWLRRVAQRPAYKAMVGKAERGEDRGVFLVLGVEAPEPFRSADVD